MTYTPTHLGISYIFYLIFRGEKLREWQQENRGKFALLTLMSIIPDIDLFLPIPHRSYTHSLVVIFVSCIVLYWVNDMLNSENGMSISKLVFIFWISHVIYDTTFGPIGYLYPLDKRFFDFKIGVIGDLSTATVSFGGILFKPIVWNPNKGVDVFFVNWTPEERIRFFGTSTIDIPIQDFFMHGTLFVFYLIKVMWPLIKITNNVNFQNVPISVRRNGFELSLALSLVIVLLIAGPLAGNNYHDADRTSVSFSVETKQFKVYNTVSLLVPEESNATISLIFPQDVLNYSIAFGSFDPEFDSRVNNVTNAVLDNYELNYSLTTLSRNFQGNISLPDSWVVVNIHPENRSIYTLKIPRSQDGTTVSIAFLLYQWEPSYSFTASVQLEVDYTIARSDDVKAMIGSIIFTAIGVAVMGYSKFRFRVVHKKSNKE